MTYRLAILWSFLLLSWSFAARAQQATFHYQPPEAVYGDPIPFYHDGVHHVFYLHVKGQMDWNHLVSRDLVHWEELAPAILADENDRMIATGSIVEKDGTFHAFYSTADRKDKGPGLASVRVATSRDLVTWTKEPGEPLLLLKRDVPEDGVYDTISAWRDPHVFWNPQAGQWWLAIAAHEKNSVGYPYAGAVALATSTDLRNWTVHEKPLLTTREGPASECPDVFPFGDGWAMVYYADTTRIRLADTPEGPWRRPANDSPWGLHYFAGKTEFDGRRRITHAYIQRSESDYTRHGYGGAMALPRELYLDDQGRVATRLVPEIIAACKDDATSGSGAAVFAPAEGDPVSVTQDGVTLSPGTGQAAMAVWKEAPADFFLTADVTLDADATLSLFLRGQSLDDSYVLTLDSHADLVTLKRPDTWNRMPPLRTQSIDLPTTGPFKLHVMLHGDILEAFVDDRISLTARVQLPAGALSLFVRDGTARLENLRIAHLVDN